MVVNLVIFRSPVPTVPPDPTPTPSATLTPTSFPRPTETPSVQPSKEPTATSQPILVETLTPTPADSPTPTLEGTPYEVPKLPQDALPAGILGTSPGTKVFGLPDAAPNALVWFDSALWVRFGQTFERLEMVEAENRFKFGKATAAPPSRALTLTNHAGDVIKLNFPLSVQVATADNQGYLWMGLGEAIKKFAASGRRTEL